MIYPSRNKIKQQAVILRDYLNQAEKIITLSSAYHAISKMHGFKNWNIFSAFLKKLDNETVEDVLNENNMLIED